MVANSSTHALRLGALLSPDHPIFPTSPALRQASSSLTKLIGPHSYKPSTSAHSQYLVCIQVSYCYYIAFESKLGNVVLVIRLGWGYPKLLPHVF
jgi:hypothetical protein